MQYPSLKVSALRTKEIPALDGGFAAEGAFGQAAGRLEECENFWWEDGALRSRPGLTAVPGTDDGMAAPVRQEIYGGTDEAAGARRKFVVLSYRGSDSVTVTAELVTLGADGEKTVSQVREYDPQALAFAFFSETGASGQGVRDNGALLFFRKAGETGGFLLLAEPEDPEDDWVDAGSRVYVPLLLSGGTGCDTPSGSSGGYELEEENLLTPRFRAQYTSGEHPYYRLPKSGLDDTAVTVSLLTPEGAALSFTVAAEASVSPASGSYRVHLDRSTGTFYFCAATGSADTPVILGDSSVMNNITVTAAKDNAQERAVLLGMSACIWYGGERGMYSGSRLFAGGNPAYPNRVAWSENQNPLYFPRLNYTQVGDASQPVAAFACLQDALIVFKPGEVYRLTAQTAEDPVSGGTIDIFPVSLIYPGAGCDCPRTIRLCSDRLVWADSRGEVYALKDADEYSNASVARLTRNIASRLAEKAGEAMKQAFALDYAGYYLLIVGREAYALSYVDSAFFQMSSGGRTGEELRWFRWDFGGKRRLDAGVADKTRAALLCREDSGGSPAGRLRYAAVLAGDSDSSPEGEAEPVSCRLWTVELGLAPLERRKSLRRLYWWLESEHGASVIYGTDQGDYPDPQRLCTPPGGGLQARSLSPSLTGIVSLRLGLASRGRTAVGRLILRYTAGRGAL